MTIVADLDIGLGPTLAARAQERIAAWGLFALLCAFTLTTFDGGDIAPRLVSAVLLVLAAAYFIVPPGHLKFKLSFPIVCLLGMTGWGVLQTLFFPQKITVDGWSGVLFWFTAAVIALLGASVFHREDMAQLFRRCFLYFASGVCVLDLLEQASSASKYFWIIPSRYTLVFGTFAYWNNLAQFVELALPLTLWQGLSSEKPKIQYLLFSALQLCASSPLVRAPAPFWCCWNWWPWSRFVICASGIATSCSAHPRLSCWRLFLSTRPASVRLSAGCRKVTSWLFAATSTGHP